MTQVEIAKKILKQGNCHGMKCYDIGCPMLSKINQICMANYPVNNGDSLYRVKQWLKKRESMIDLTENQIVDPPIQCWIKKSNKSEWDSTNLYGIDHRLMSPYICSTGNWQYCTLTDPTVPTKKIKKWLTIEDVPAELFGKVLIKGKNDRYTTAWILEPCSVNWKATQDLVYLPLGQPLTGEWLPFESEE